MLSEGWVKLSVNDSVVVVGRAAEVVTVPGWPQWYSSLWQTTEAHVRNKVILCHVIVSSSVV